MLEDHTFQRRFRMDYPSFKFLYGLVRPNLNRVVEMANLRNGVVAREGALASTLRWLSGGSYFEMMDGPTITSSTAYSVPHRTLEAVDSCPDLAIVWPDDDRLDHVAAGFRARSRKASWTAAQERICTTPCLSFEDQPRRLPDHLMYHTPDCCRLCESICDARYIFTAGCISCPGGTNDRTAWNM
ncbi:unnamed protein product [Discosporangium mesarthrocarpum]